VPNSLPDDPTQIALPGLQEPTPAAPTTAGPTQKAQGLPDDPTQIEVPSLETLPASVSPQHEDNSTAGWLTRNGKQLVRDLDKGATAALSMPGDLGELLGWGAKHLGASLPNSSPIERGANAVMSVFPTQESTERDLAAAGAGPQQLTPGEKSLHSGIEAAAGAGPFGPVQMAGSAAITPIAQKVLEELPDDTSPWIREGLAGLFGIIGGVGAEKISAITKSSAEFRAAQQAVKDAEQQHEATLLAKQQALEEQKAWFDQNTNLAHPTEPGLTETTADVAKRQHQEAVEKALQTTDKYTSDIAENISPISHSNPYALGQNIQEAVRNWSKTDFHDQLDTAEAPLRAKVSPSAPVEFGPVFTKLDELEEHNSGELKDITGALNPSSVKPLINRFLSYFAKKDEAAGKDPLADDAVPKLPEDATFDWKTARDFRSAVGAARHDKQLVDRFGAGNLEALYATLTNQLRETAIDHDALQEFNQYNQRSTDLHDLRDRFLARFADDGERLPEDSTKIIAKSLEGNGSLPRALRYASPDVADQFARHYLEQNGIKGWSALAQDAKESLIPDANVRLQLDSAAEGHANAVESSKNYMKMRVKQFNNEKQNVVGNLKNASSAHSNAYSDLNVKQRALGDLQSEGNLLNSMKKPSALAMGVLGAAAGSALGGTHGAGLGAIGGEALGLLRHAAGASVHGLISNPRRAALSAGSAAAVSNALNDPSFRGQK